MKDLKGGIELLAGPYGNYKPSDGVNLIVAIDRDGGNGSPYPWRAVKTQLDIENMLLTFEEFGFKVTAIHMTLGDLDRYSAKGIKNVVRLTVSDGGDNVEFVDPTDQG